jgi:hypothetical protein
MEEIDPIGRIVRLCGGCTAAGGKLGLEEGVLFTASETAARGREGGAVGTVPLPVAFDFRDAIEPAGETTDGREVAFTSVGGGLYEAADASEASKVDVRDLGAGGAPVAEVALGGSIDCLLLGGAGLDEAIVAVFVEFADDVVAGFFAVDGEAVAVLERGEGAVALAGEATLAWPALNVAEPKACPAHG